MSQDADGGNKDKKKQSVVLHTGIKANSDNEE